MSAYILLFRFEHKQTQLRKKFFLRGAARIDCGRHNCRYSVSYRNGCANNRTNKTVYSANAATARLITTEKRRLFDTNSRFFIRLQKPQRASYVLQLYLLLLVYFLFKNAYFVQSAETFLIVHSVSYHKFVGDFESDILNVYIHYSPRRFGQQRCNINACGVTL